MLIPNILVANYFVIVLKYFLLYNKHCSAYSIFNEDFRELPGTLNADRLDRDIRAGQFWALPHSFQSPRHWCQVTWCIAAKSQGDNWLAKELTSTVPMKMTKFSIRPAPLLCIYHVRCTDTIEMNVSLWIIGSMSLLPRLLFMNFRVHTFGAAATFGPYMQRLVRNQKLRVVF